MVQKFKIWVPLLVLGTIILSGYLIVQGQQQPSPSIPVTSIATQTIVAGTPTLTSTIPSTTTVTKPGKVAARIDVVNTNNLKLGKVSYAYIILTNTGDVPIARERVEIVAGKDFGFLLGYRSRSFVQDFSYDIGIGETKNLEEQFNLPSYEGFVYLGGVYDVSVNVYANDVYVDSWNGEVTLTS